MIDPHHRDPLEEALAELPRVRSTTDFTDRTLGALDRRRDRQRRLRRMGWVAALAAVAVCLAIAQGFERRHSSQRSYRNQVEALELDYRQLREEIASVRHQAEDTRIYLGGDDSLQLVLDLSRAEPAVDTGTGDVRPARLDPTSDGR